MDITVKAKELRNSLDDVIKVTKGGMQGYSIVSTEGDSISLSAFSQELSLNLAVNATVNDGGKCLIPSLKMFRVLYGIEGDVHLFVDGKKGVIEYETSRYSYSLPQDSVEYFQIKTGEESCLIREMETAQLLSTIERIRYASSFNDAREILSSVLIHIKEESITLVASDGKRMAFLQYECQTSSNSEYQFLVHKKYIPHIVRLFGDVGSLEVGHIGKGSLVLSSPLITLFIPLTDAEYPKYIALAEMFAQDTEASTVTLDRGHLIASLRRATGIFSHATLHSGLRVSTGDDTLLLTGEYESFSFSECLDADVKGESSNLIEPKYLLEHVENFSDESSVSLHCYENKIISYHPDGTAFTMCLRDDKRE